jgi:hypothetical protein
MYRRRLCSLFASILVAAAVLGFSVAPPSQLGCNKFPCMLKLQS